MTSPAPSAPTVPAGGGPRTVARPAADALPGGHDPAVHARTARLGLMHVLEPQDSCGSLLVAALGPVRAWEIVSGRSRIGPAEARRASEDFPSHASCLDSATLSAAVCRWAARAAQPVPEGLVEAMAAQGAWLAVPEDPDWPAALAGLEIGQPLGLWGKGERDRLASETDTNIAFVGSRDATAYGEAVTGHLAGDLAAAGYGVLSGGAFGIDAAAHRAALAASVRDPATVAFLACGIDRWYPRANSGLLEDVARAGLVLTEVPPGTSPMRHRFLQRNRLIAAMSATTVVVEARWRSGALNTAHHALGMGRTVAAVPGSVFSAQSAGCHRLLAEGMVEMVTSTRDLKDLMTSEPVPTGSEASPPDDPHPDGGAAGAELPRLTEAQGLVRDALPAARAVDTDRLCSTAGLSVREVLPALVRLEDMGLAQRDGQGRWRLVRNASGSRPGRG